MLTVSVGGVHWVCMKTIFSIIFGLLISLGAVSTASAQVYYSYNGNYQNNYQYTNQYSNNSSYYYTSGCYTYYHNGYTGNTTITGYTCQNQNYTYTQPVTQTYYTSPYYTYSYSNGSWCNTNTGYGYNYGTYGNNYNYTYDNYSGGQVYTPTSNCYYVNGVYSCYLMQEKSTQTVALTDDRPLRW